MTVCFVGAWDPSYPRNRILWDGLAAAGVTVTAARVPERRVVFRYPELVRRLVRTPDADAWLVPSFRHKDVPLARLLAGRRPLVFDPLVSRHDTLVGDWRLHAPGSLQAWWNRRIDRASLRLADAVLCDTWEHGRLFAELGASYSRLHRVPVGAERVFFELPPPPPPQGGPVEVVYAGGFLPLHGVPTLVDALARLERRSGLPEYRVRLIGGGIELDAARAAAERHALRRVRFEGRLPYAELPAQLASAHVVLGAFGAGAKADRVIPHKVWQGLAAGRAVVSGDAAGVRELFEPEVHLRLVPRGEPGPLAEALAQVIGEPALRTRLGQAARARALEVGAPERIGAKVAGIVRALLR